MADTPVSPQPTANHETLCRPLLKSDRRLPRLRGPLQRFVDELGPELASSELPAFSIVAIHGRAQRRRTLITLNHGHLVAGRHSEADLFLDGDPSVSLRHLLMRAVHLGDGTVALRILDLDTPTGFSIEGGDEVRSLVATGPFAVAVGEWVIVGIPHGCHSSPPVGPGPYRVSAPVLHRAEHPPQRGNHDDQRSHITLLPSAGWVGARGSAAIAARIELSSHRGEDSLPVTRAMLDHGVLLGRYDRCIDRGSRGISTKTISRTHALILRDGDVDRVYDLSSTAGTFLEGRRIRSAALAPTGSKIRLASDDPVHVDWSSAESQ